MRTSPTLKDLEEEYGLVMPLVEVYKILHWVEVKRVHNGLRYILNHPTPNDVPVMAVAELIEIFEEERECKRD
jgi:hypothetical protein